MWLEMFSARRSHKSFLARDGVDCAYVVEGAYHSLHTSPTTFGGGARKESDGEKEIKQDKAGRAGTAPG